MTDMDWHITFYKEGAEGKKDQVKNLLVEKLEIFRFRVSSDMPLFFVLYRLDSRLAGRGSRGTTTSFLIPRDF